jgi:hypothetical protein
MTGPPMRLARGPATVKFTSEDMEWAAGGQRGRERQPELSKRRAVRKCET